MRCAGALAVIMVLAGCGSTIPQHVPVQESFGSTETFSRMFDASPAQTCEAARRALESGPWARMRPAERTRLLLKLAVALDQHGDELALLVTLNTGKPL